MVKTMDVCNSSKEPGGFWETCRACAEADRVRSDRFPFCLNRARDFANYLPEKPLTNGCRDRVIPGEVKRQFSELVEAAKTEVRAGHFSHRAETASLD